MEIYVDAETILARPLNSLEEISGRRWPGRLGRKGGSEEGY